LVEDEVEQKAMNQPVDIADFVMSLPGLFLLLLLAGQKGLRGLRASSQPHRLSPVAMTEEVFSSAFYLRHCRP